MVEENKDFIKVEVRTGEAAKNLLESMLNICKAYNVCYVGDMFDLLELDYDENLPHRNFWISEDLSGAKILQNPDETVAWVQLPQPRSNAEPVKAAKPDMVAHPPHYQTESGLETIDVIKAFTNDLKGIEATDTGNVIKYICRWGKKNGLEDLEKAQWYLNHLINEVKERLKKENVQHG